MEESALLSEAGRSTRNQIRRASRNKNGLEELKKLVDKWSAKDLDAMARTDGKNALHMAAWQGTLESAKFLLNIGCDVNQISTSKYSYGKTPIFFAITRCRDDMCALLLENGANVKIVNNKGQSVLSLAVTHLKAETIQAIQEAETRQGHLKWHNYFDSHWDGAIYGDLDPRFINRPLNPQDILMDGICVNPTTRNSRKGNFSRNNPHLTRETIEKSDKPKLQKEKFVCESPTEIELADYESNWKEIELALQTCDSKKLGESIISVVKFWEYRKKAWVETTGERLGEAIKTDLNVMTEKENNIAAAVTFLQESCLYKEREIMLVKRLLNVSTKRQFGKRKNPGKKESVDVLYRNRIQEMNVKVASCKSFVNNLSWSFVKNNASSTKYLSLPEPPVLIDTVREMINFKNTLTSFVHSCNLSPIAFDAEWTSTSNSEPCLATIQFAWVDELSGIPKSWVIDLRPNLKATSESEYEQYRDIVSGVICWLFIKSGAMVLGFSPTHDFKMLHTFTGEKFDSSSVNCIDLQVLLAEKMEQRQQYPGLKACCDHCLRSCSAQVDSKVTTCNWELSKKEQTSDWGRRPLTAHQLEYAALDAVVLLILLSNLKTG